MNYDQLRAVAQDGDVVFIKNGTTPWAWLISAWTDSPYSHAMFVFWYADRLLVAEASPHGGTRIVSASVYQKRQFDIIAAPLSWTAIQAQAVNRAGSAVYGWLSAVWIGLRTKVFALTGRKLPTWRNHSVVCSEYVAEVLGLEDTDVTPGELYHCLICELGAKPKSSS